MALTNNLVEQLAEWCGTSDVLGDIRSKARSDFFGYDEPGDVKYIADSGEINGRERRFRGWFGFSFILSDGKHPAEMAAADLLKGTELASALNSIQNTRYVIAVTTMIIPGKGIYLKLEDEEFEVDSRILSQVLHKDDALCAHILPVGRSRWLVCPGWLVWPTRLGSNMRSRLKKFQIDPINLERLLQQRATNDEKRIKIEHYRDSTLQEAVSRMTKEAQTAGEDRLILSVEEWKALVLSCMRSSDITKFSKKIFKMVGKATSLDELNKWLALAMNIWNATPQPDRGGKTANEIFKEQREL